MIGTEVEKKTHLGLKAQAITVNSLQTQQHKWKSVFVCSPLCFCACVHSTPIVFVCVCAFVDLEARVCETQGGAGEGMHTEC